MVFILRVTKRANEHRLRIVLVAAVAAGLVLSSLLLSPARATSSSVQSDVSNDSNWHGGEPELAVNPVDTNNVVMVWPEEDSTGIYRNPLTGTFDPITGTGVGYTSDEGFSRCGLGVSTDGGVTWNRSVLPAQTAQSTLCSDAAIAAGPDGTFYAATITFHQPSEVIPGVPPAAIPDVLGSFQPEQGEADVVLSSSDGGKTWTFPPVDAIGNRGNDASRYESGSNPATGGMGTGDRPWISVDQNTGTVYVSGTADIIQFNGTTRTAAFVTASHDRAKSFGTIYPVDSSAFPESGGDDITADHGVLAVAYIGTVGQSSTNQVIFETSTNDGKTFVRHALAAPVSSGESAFGVNVAQDPSRPGHYAVAVPGSGTTGLIVYQTTDSGSTWSKPATVQVGTSRPWIAYSPNGVLGVMGRAVASDNSQTVLAAFLPDGGSSFQPPTTVSTSPSPPSGNAYISLYDDVSWITMTNCYAYLAWGDWRHASGDTTGETNAWMARLDLPRSSNCGGAAAAGS